MNLCVVLLWLSLGLVMSKKRGGTGRKMTASSFNARLGNADEASGGKLKTIYMQPGDRVSSLHLDCNFDNPAWSSELHGSISIGNNSKIPSLFLIEFEGQQLENKMEIDSSYETTYLCFDLSNPRDNMIQYQIVLETKDYTDVYIYLSILLGVILLLLLGLFLVHYFTKYDICSTCIPKHSSVTNTSEESEEKVDEKKKLIQPKKKVVNKSFNTMPRKVPLPKLPPPKLNNKADEIKYVNNVKFKDTKDLKSGNYAPNIG